MPSSGANLKQMLQLTAAPMAGISTPIYRLLARTMGATLAFTEMISAKGLLNRNRRSHELLEIAEGEKPAGAQLFGTDPEELANAAAMVQEKGFDVVDINMGCPVRKVVSTGAGAALMREPVQAARIVEAVKKRVTLPVTAKIRSGWTPDEINAPQMAATLESAGLDALIVHARTRDQGYAGRADWRLIAEIKARAGIPIIGNGDVTSGASALQMLQTTGCDGIMIGRAALGNPWVFRECREALSGRDSRVKPEALEIYRIFLIHFRGLRSEVGPIRATRIMKRFASWYTRGFRGAPAARAAIHRSARGRAIRKAVKGVLLGSCAS